MTEEEYQMFKNQEQTKTAESLLKEAIETSTAAFAETMVNKNKIASLDLTSINTSITTMSNTLASHTNSIQSLDTRTGSHTASIGQLENRMTDVELQTTTNKNKIAALESSGGTISHIGDLNIKSDGSEYTYDIVEKYNGSETTTTTYTFATLIGGLDQLLSNINVLSSRLERTENQILSMSRLLLEIKTKLGM